MDMKEIYDKMVEKANNDESFKKELLLNPKNAFASIGITFPDDVEVSVFESTEKHIHFVLPQAE